MGPYYDAISLMIERLPEPHLTAAARYRGVAADRPATPPHPHVRRLPALGKGLWSLLVSPLRGQRRYVRS